MRVPRTRRARLATAAVALAVLATPGAGSGGPGGRPDDEGPWRAGRALPIAVAGGRARFAVPTAGEGSKTLVIVSALARGAGPFPIRLSARPATSSRPPRPADDGPARAPDLAAPAVEPVPEPAVGPPAAERTFHLLVRDGDPASAGNYTAVAARLRAVGRRVQVYVDDRDAGRVGADVLRELISTFDGSVFPAAAATIGQARDVDGDGRFTVLLTGWLARLGGGRLAVDGFVRAADLDPDLSPPFGNRCDMMYLGADLRPGPHLRTVVAHEYTHAVTLSRKARAGIDEEGWLDEALAHLVEDRHGFSRSNIDYRISAFLSAPERYRLVVPDYYAADLFRSHGNRGSTYLFLRWCADRFGPALVPALIGSPRRGVANLEAATGRSFAHLYRQWTVALALGDADPGPSDGWVLAGPRTAAVSPGGRDNCWSAAGTTSHFAVVSGSPLGAVEVEVAGPPAAQLQVTAIPLPADAPRVELAVRVLPGEDSDLHIRALARERDGAAVRLSALAWEPLVPAADPRASGPRRGALDGGALAAAFGSADLPARGRLASSPIRLAGVRRGDGPLIVKLVGTDARGRRVAAWAEVDPGPEPVAGDDPEGP
jgi:hypothetical protein